MSKNGIPSSMITIIAYIYNKTNISFKSQSGYFNTVLQTRVGVPEGCTLSPTLFALYLSDLDQQLNGTTIKIGNTKIAYIVFADDICITCGTENELRTCLKTLEDYYKEKKMSINIDKTKTMIIHKGRLPKIQPFSINQTNLENVNKYKYLGIWFTTSMNFNEHIKFITNKARSKIGYLWKMLNIGELSLDVTLQIFDCYIQPIYTYGIGVWWQNSNKNIVQMINATFTMYIKIWMKIPVASTNSLFYFTTKTTELNNTLEKDFRKQISKINLPHLDTQILNGVRQEETFHAAFKVDNNLHVAGGNIREKITEEEELNKNISTHNQESKMSIHMSQIPSYLWFNRTLHDIPKRSNLRRKLMLDIFGWNHRYYCSNKKFHFPYLHLKENSKQYDFMHDNAKHKTYCSCLLCGEQQISFNHHCFCSSTL